MLISDLWELLVMRAQRPVIVVHGGAGEWRPERQKAGVAGVREAAGAGFDVLKTGGTALDAVEAAVMSMEDNEVFNAGLGSSLALDQSIEMEASIMDGKSLEAGAVGLLRDVRYPIQLARLVMEHTDHVFVIGRGAERLADASNLERRNPLTKLRERYWRELKRKMAQNRLTGLPRLTKLMTDHPTLFTLDTVGAVATDQDGDLAAATSTGGRSFKIPGRIGDSPLIGCGNYADNESAACSATGMGEIAIRLVLAKSTCNFVRAGQSPQEATESAIAEVNRRIHDVPNQMGLIAVDPVGRIGATHNSPHMCWAFMAPEMKTPTANLHAMRPH